MAPNAAFNQKLHLIYLINDLLHHWLVAKELNYDFFKFVRGWKCIKVKLPFQRQKKC